MVRNKVVEISVVKILNYIYSVQWTEMQLTRDERASRKVFDADIFNTAVRYQVNVVVNI